jgi:capsular polysaccharide biosynthesis protein
LTKINFEKTSPQKAQSKMEDKINHNMMIVSIVGSIILTVIYAIYVTVLKKALKTQNSIEEVEDHR